MFRRKRKNASGENTDAGQEDTGVGQDTGGGDTTAETESDGSNDTTSLPDEQQVTQ